MYLWIVVVCLIPDVAELCDGLVGILVIHHRRAKEVDPNSKEGPDRQNKFTTE